MQSLAKQLSKLHKATTKQAMNQHCALSACPYQFYQRVMYHFGIEERTKREEILDT